MEQSEDSREFPRFFEEVRVMACVLCGHGSELVIVVCGRASAGALTGVGPLCHSVFLKWRLQRERDRERG